MNWKYQISTGELSRVNGSSEVVGVGYSGNGEGKNNPAMQEVRDVGPLPCGWYKIGAPQNTTDHGPFALPLTPAPTNKMYGRSGFWMHGDSIPHPGNASLGCMIQDRAVRALVAASGADDLEVVE